MAINDKQVSDKLVHTNDGQTVNEQQEEILRSIQEPLENDIIVEDEDIREEYLESRFPEARSQSIYAPTTSETISSQFSEYQGLSFGEFMEKINHSVFSSHSNIVAEYDDEKHSITFMVKGIGFVSFPIFPEVLELSASEKHHQHYRKCPHGSYEKCIWSKLQTFTKADKCPSPNSDGVIYIETCPHIHVDDIGVPMYFIFSWRNMSFHQSINVSFSNKLGEESWLINGHFDYIYTLRERMYNCYIYTDYCGDEHYIDNDTPIPEDIRQVYHGCYGHIIDVDDHDTYTYPVGFQLAEYPRMVVGVTSP